MIVWLVVSDGVSASSSILSINKNGAKKYSTIYAYCEREGERGKEMRGRGGGRGEKTGGGGENMWCTYDDVGINIPKQDVDVIWRDGTALHTTLMLLKVDYFGLLPIPRGEKREE